MVGQLDLKAGLEHLADQGRQQPAIARELNALAAGPLDQLSRPRPHRRLVTHQTPRYATAAQARPTSK
jgi:hypothetical protein